MSSLCDNDDPISNTNFFAGVMLEFIFIDKPDIPSYFYIFVDDRMIDNAVFSN